MTDPFFDAYDREDVAYGMEPSSVLASYLQQVGSRGRAVDLGAGAGRDSLALAAAGYEVTSVDLSRRGLQRIEERARAAGLADRITTLYRDVRNVPLPPESFDAVVATTVLDHIELPDAAELWSRMSAALRPNGFLYCQVHTTEDPGSGRPPGCHRDAPISETAAAVINYFAPNQLAQWAIDVNARLRILRYEERLEWDYSHGPQHLHGKAVLLAVRNDFHPDWYGFPVAFPRPSAADRLTRQPNVLLRNGIAQEHGLGRSSSGSYARMHARVALGSARWGEYQPELGKRGSGRIPPGRSLDIGTATADTVLAEIDSQ